MGLKSTWIGGTWLVQPKTMVQLGSCGKTCIQRAFCIQVLMKQGNVF